MRDAALEVDVCLLAEDAELGFAADLAEALTTLRFALVRVGGRDRPGEAPGPLTANVLRFEEIFAEESAPRRPFARAGGRLAPLAKALFAEGPLDAAEAALEAARGLAPEEALLALPDILAEGGDAPLPLLERVREAGAALGPVLRVVAADLPRAAVYHAVSCGLDGLAGALAARRSGAPLVVTDRGRPAASRERPERRLARRLALGCAAAVVTPFAAGCADARAVVIPDGIAVDALAGVRARGAKTAAKDALLVGLLAPVAPREDVKTFIRAAKLLIDRLDLVEVLVVGARDVDERYYRDCILLAQTLGIDRLVRFSGAIAARELFLHLDCACSTAAGPSEPRALVEAMAAGVPLVATDAGARRELLLGRTAEDRALGAAGLLAPIADHEAIAAAIVRVLRDHALARRLAEAGEARVDRFYRRERTLEAYRALYERVRKEARRA